MGVSLLFRRQTVHVELMPFDALFLRKLGVAVVAVIVFAFTALVLVVTFVRSFAFVAFATIAIINSGLI